MELKLVDKSEVEGIVCEDVTEAEVENILTEYVPGMEKIVKELGGYGVAAPQIGVKKKFFVARTAESEEFNVYFNAFFIKDGASRTTRMEGCLSYGLQNYAPVKRFKSIRLIYDKWEDGKLVKKNEKFKSLDAAIMSHEAEHLIGKTIYYR